MTDEQFKQLMEKLDRIERELSKPDKGSWGPAFQPAYPRPEHYWPAPWPLPQVTD